MKLLVATTNLGKLAEMERLLRACGIELAAPDHIAAPCEIGQSFQENALLKARHYNSLAGMPTIAEDSGLEVEALGGAPGPLSARYAGESASDADRIAKLLSELRGVPPPKRAARFVSAIAFCSKGIEGVFVGSVYGLILGEPRGLGGFGYDPVFYYEPFGRTFAELTAEEKSAVSHRGRALRSLLYWMKQSGLLDRAKSSDKIPSEKPTLNEVI
jgi:XTP/dITP diphosphohydrolase